MEKDILKSWGENADEWIKIIDANEIRSRTITNRAIIDLLAQLPSKKLLDCGCGEGWLSRRMTKFGKTCVGIDATPALIANAKTKGPGHFYHMTYQQIGDGATIPETPYDAAVFNFSLYQKNGLERLLKNVKKVLQPQGYLAIQTIHPFFLIDRAKGYYSQFIEDSWAGLPGDFTNGHRWYARTFEDWSHIFFKSDLALVEIRETQTTENTPLSVIFLLQHHI